MKKYASNWASRLERSYSRNSRPGRPRWKYRRAYGGKTSTVIDIENLRPPRLLTRLPVIQSSGGQVNDDFMELLICISAAKLASARKVHTPESMYRGET